jgi:hypothetical protein
LQRKQILANQIRIPSAKSKINFVYKTIESPSRTARIALKAFENKIKGHMTPSRHSKKFSQPVII